MQHTGMEEQRAVEEKAGRLPCYIHHVEMEQLRRLKEAYRCHLQGTGRTRLPWLEMAIDRQQRDAAKAREVRNKARPRGCAGCPGREGCSYTPNGDRRRVLDRKWDR